MPIATAFTGTWFDPDESGHGLVLEVLPPAAPGQPRRLLAWWFSFDPQGRQAWFGGLGTIHDDHASVEVVRTTGGRWRPDFDPAAIDHEAWGSFILRFSDCRNGHIDYESLDPAFGEGSMPLLRLTVPEQVACE